MRYLSREGFTLLEILVVLIIIALTLSIVFPKMFPLLGTNDRRREISKLIEKINGFRWKAFEKKEMVMIYENKGVVSAKLGEKTEVLWQPDENVSLVMSDALVCMPNGAVNGMTMRVDYGNSSFYVVFTPFDGDVEKNR